MSSTLIPLAVFGYVPEAHIARSYLEAHGIKTFTFDEYFTATHWHLATAVGGIRIMVMRDDYEEAAALLKDAETIYAEIWPKIEMPSPPLFLDYMFSFFSAFFFFFGGLLLLPWHKRKK